MLSGFICSAKSHGRPMTTRRSIGLSMTYGEPPPPARGWSRHCSPRPTCTLCITSTTRRLDAFREAQQRFPDGPRAFLCALESGLAHAAPGTQRGCEKSFRGTDVRSIPPVRKHLRRSIGALVWLRKTNQFVMARAFLRETFRIAIAIFIMRSGQAAD